MFESLSKDVGRPFPLISSLIHLLDIHGGASHPVDVEASKEDAGDVGSPIFLVPANLKTEDGVNEGEEQVERPTKATVAPNPRVWVAGEKLHDPWQAFY